jgi:hypothetical protein
MITVKLAQLHAKLSFVILQIVSFINNQALPLAAHTNSVQILQ